MSECSQCNKQLEDDYYCKMNNIKQFFVSDKRLCKKCYDEISDYMKKPFTYKEADERHHKDYPKIWADNKFYKKLGKY